MNFGGIDGIVWPFLLYIVHSARGYIGQPDIEMNNSAMVGEA